VFIPETSDVSRQAHKRKAKRWARRRASLKGIKTEAGKDRDEYPPAMFKEGGAGADVKHIDSCDNRGAGSCMGHQCAKYPNGTRVKIRVR